MTGWFGPTCSGFGVIVTNEDCVHFVVEHLQDGILESYWGEHIHLGYYNEEERKKVRKGFRFVTCYYCIWCMSWLPFSGLVSKNKSRDLFRSGLFCWPGSCLFSGPLATFSRARFASPFFRVNIEDDGATCASGQPQARLHTPCTPQPTPVYPKQNAKSLIYPTTKHRGRSGRTSSRPSTTSSTRWPSGGAWLPGPKPRQRRCWTWAAAWEARLATWRRSWGRRRA